MTPGLEHVLCIPDPDIKQEETKSGLVIERSYQKRSESEVVLKWGTVEKVGEGVVMPLKKGMRMCYNPFDSYRIEIAGEHKYDVVKAVGIHAYE